MKGIILAGGNGTRLYPLTKAVNKHFLPVYDKPMIYYSLSVLMLADIKDILLISRPEDIEGYSNLLSDGSHLGVAITYAEQPSADGLAQAFLIGEDFIGDDSVALVLGDNLFYGHGLSKVLKNAVNNNTGATIFAKQVKDPERYGIVTFDDLGCPKELIEKPDTFCSNWAVTGLYMYSNDVIKYAKLIKPSIRNELEITDLNSIYLQKENLNLVKLSRGYVWLDMGTQDSLVEASEFVRVAQLRSDSYIAALEEIAFNKGWISNEQLSHFIKNKNSPYVEYLKKLVILSG